MLSIYIVASLIFCYRDVSYRSFDEMVSNVLPSYVCSTQLAFQHILLYYPVSQGAKKNVTTRCVRYLCLVLIV
jgi:hypothetical protein